MPVAAQKIGIEPPAVAAVAPRSEANPDTPPASPSSPITLTVPADVAGGHGTPDRFADVTPVGGIDPHKGWFLSSQMVPGFDAERDWIEYSARTPYGEAVTLSVSRFFFDPTNERFRWLVDHRFPPGRKSPATGVLCPLTNADIDDAIEAELIEANRKHRVGLMNFAAAVVLMLSGVVIAALGVAAHG